MHAAPSLETRSRVSRRSPRTSGPSGCPAGRRRPDRSPSGSRSRSSRRPSRRRPAPRARGRAWHPGRRCAERSSRPRRCCGRGRRRRRRGSGCPGGSRGRPADSASTMSYQACGVLGSGYPPPPLRIEPRRTRPTFAASIEFFSTWVIWPIFSSSVIWASSAATRSSMGFVASIQGRSADGDPGGNDPGVSVSEAEDAETDGGEATDVEEVRAIGRLPGSMPLECPWQRCYMPSRTRRR